MDQKYLLFFLGALGALNGLLLSSYFLVKSKKNNLAGLFLGGLLAALSLRIGKSVVVYFDAQLSRIYLQIGLSACLLIGPMLRMFLKASLEQISILPYRWKVELSLLAVLILNGLLVPYVTQPALWNQYIIKFIYGIWLIYMVISARYLFQKLPKLTKIRSYSLVQKWTLVIYIANLAIFTLFFIALFFGRLYNTYYAGGLFFSFALYGMILVALFKGRSAWPFHSLLEKSPTKKLDEAEAKPLLNSLELLMQNSATYQKPDLSLAELAKMLGTSTHTLSQLLNNNLGQSFTAYINGYRIALACQLISSGHPYSLEALGYEVGFNSKSTFYTAFKKVTGTTPQNFELQIGTEL